MAYDEALAARVRDVLADERPMEEKRMFGGVAWLLDGHMVCGVSDDDLIVRIGPEAYEAALGEPYTDAFGPAGRAMTGWVRVEPEGLTDEGDLAAWVDAAVTFVGTLPPKDG